MRCPRCSTELDPTVHDATGMLTCTCGHRAYAGFVAEADALDDRLHWLAARIGAGDPPPEPHLAAQYRVWPAPGPGPSATAVDQVGAGAVGAVATGPAARPARPTPSAQTLLLGVGALLLVVAGAVFAAVVWQRLGALGQVALMLAATLGIGALAIALRTRLAATAEALAVVAAGLAAIDLLAAPVLGLLPERWLSDPTLYPAVVLAALGLGLLALHRRFGLRAWRWLGWAAMPLAAGAVVPAVDHLTSSAAWPAAAVSLLALVSLALLAAAALAPGLRADRPAMQLAGWAGLLVAGLGVAAAASSRDSLPGALATTALSAAAVVALALHARSRATGQHTSSPFDATALLGLAAAALVGGALGMALALPPEPQPRWLAAVVAAAGLALGLALLGGLDEQAPAIVAAGATWACWAWLQVTLGPFDDATGTEAQLALLCALVAAIALVCAWWLPWAAWVGALLGMAALGLADPDLPEVVEAVSLPFAALLLAAGLLWRRLRPGPSLLWLGPAVTVALLPSAFATWGAPWAWGDPSADLTWPAVRLGGVLLLGVIAAVAGARWRLGGLLLPAAAALGVAALGQLLSGLANLPRWVGLALAGTLLIVAGARIEALRREGHRAATWVGELR